MLTPRLPYPPNDGGAMAMYHMAKTLHERGHQLTLAALNTSKHWQDPGAMRTLAEVHTTDVDTRVRPLAALRSLLFGKIAYNIERFDHPQHHLLLASLVRQRQFDLIQVEGTYLALYVDTIRQYTDAPIILRAHNVEYQIWQRMANSEKNPFKRWYYRHLAKRGLAFEKQYLPKFDGIVGITQQDADSFGQLGYQGALQAIPAGVAAGTQPELESHMHPHSLAFIGSLDWLPNVQGLEWFITKVWPLVQKHSPHLSFHVAGKNPTARVLNWNYPGLKMHGQVPDAQAFLSRYSVIVCPLLSGSGLRIKLLEAMAKGKAIVATQVAAEGLEIEPGTHMIVTDDPAAFARAVCTLLEDAGARESMGKAAQARMEARYSWQVIAERFEAFYQLLITRKSSKNA